jgi:hypothetical protein
MPLPLPFIDLQVGREVHSGREGTMNVAQVRLPFSFDTRLARCDDLSAQTGGQWRDERRGEILLESYSYGKKLVCPPSPMPSTAVPCMTPRILRRTAQAVQVCQPHGEQSGCPWHYLSPPSSSNSDSRCDSRRRARQGTIHRPSPWGIALYTMSPQVPTKVNEAASH